MDTIENFNNWLPPEELVEWAKFSLCIDKPNEYMTDDDIRQTIRWIGDCSSGPIPFPCGRLRWSRLGINNMLLVTLMVFPDYYMKYELSQFN
jgi:hypothetical protein